MINLILGKSQPHSWITEIILLAARVFAGLSMALAGLDKLPTPVWMVDQVAPLGFPAPAFFAFAACFSEFVGGTLLVVGLFTPVVSFLLAFTMGVAAFGHHATMPFIGLNLTQTYFWIYLIFMATGPGRVALDTFIRSLMFPGKDRKPSTSLAWGIALIVALPPASYALYREVLYTPPSIIDTSEEISFETISVAGSFNNWDPTAFQLLSEDPMHWSGTRRFDSPTPIEFKFTVNNSWQMNLGESNQEGDGFPVQGIGELDADNIVAYIPSAGTYRFSINTSTYAYSLTVEPDE